MPRKTRNVKRKANKVLSEDSKKTVASVAEAANVETLETYLTDFDIQTDTFKMQAKRQFTTEAKKLLKLLPQKAGVPKEILNMPLTEFRERGGTLLAVMQSLKQDKLDKNPTAKSAELPKAVWNDTDLVTPALATRSKQLTADSAATATKRKPKPLEQVSMTTMSTTSGSPVDELTFLQLHMDKTVEDMKSKLMESTACFPQKWRSQLIRSLKDVKMQVKMQDSVFLTPAIHR